MARSKNPLKRIITSYHTLQQNLLYLILNCGLIGIVISLVMGVSLHFSVSSMVIFFSLGLLDLICICISHFLKRSNLASALLSLGINNFLFPFLFFAAGGYLSGVPVWMVLGLSIPLLTIRGKASYALFGINAAGCITTLVVGYLYPQYIQPPSSDLAVLVNIMLSIIMVTLIFGFILRFQAYTYELQQKKTYSALEDATKATHAKTEFLSSVTHDIRTPMDSIIGFTELAKKNIDDRAKLLDCFAKISLSSNHLLNLINEVLDMNQIELGRIKVDEEICNVRKLVSDTCQIMQPELDDKNITLQLDLANIKTESILCDKLKMNQVLLNLLSNAAKFSDENTTVTVTVCEYPTKDSARVLFEFRIKDQGRGVPEDFRHRIFEPFERSKEVEKQSIPGTGLGLTITKNLVELMGGTIKMQEVAPHGTEFIISIPFSVSGLTALDDENEENEDDSFNFEGFRILLVDDNVLSRELTKENLVSKGCIVDEANDGSIAFEKITRSEPGYYNLVLMDLSMPNWDGYKTTEYIRSIKDEELAKVPVVAFSANAFEDSKRKALDVGMNAYLTKPLNMKDLMKVLKLILLTN